MAVAPKKGLVGSCEFFVSSGIRDLVRRIVVASNHDIRGGQGFSTDSTHEVEGRAALGGEA
jgi:hypothetical protein